MFAARRSKTVEDINVQWAEHIARMDTTRWTKQLSYLYPYFCLKREVDQIPDSEMLLRTHLDVSDNVQHGIV